MLYAALLQACTTSSSFSHGLQLHSHLLKSGLDDDHFVGNSLLSFYFKVSPDFSLTRRVFESLPNKDVISWTSMISGYVRGGRPAESLLMFAKMQAFGVEPNAAVVDMYGKNSALEDAWRVFHEMIEPNAICWTSMISACTRNGNVVVESSTVDMYAKCGLMEESHKVFDRMPTKNAVSWCALLGGYCKSGLSAVRQGKENGRGQEAIKLFDEMVREGTRPDYISFIGVLFACSHTGLVEEGRRVGLLEEAEDLINKAVCRDDSSLWAALLGACATHSSPAVAERIAKRMMELEPGYHLSYVLLANVYKMVGRWDDALKIRRLMRKRGVRKAPGKISDIRMNIIHRVGYDGGFAQNGRGQEAIKLFDEMVREGTRPDYISFIGVLFACSHTGLVKEGRKYFKLMNEDYGIAAGIEHYSCMVDLLSRVGLLEEAEDLINKAVCRDDSSLWAALLGACATHSSPAVAERIAKRMMELEPGYHLSYVLLANVYKMVGRWDDALKIRRLMRKRGVRKAPGKSGLK
ncbi:pentatricopeptide repeat-containing protein [Cocos nucifera]|uniref:Pentatricopeptide repeat-containing protein n=1 Tax=Cocos nucifera TaxID=13894 RepID=A0A8K0IR82_COCNU|nr:pentatricopeptide repeat-containing protein [Cocos nucifera]